MSTLGKFHDPLPRFFVQTLAGGAHVVEVVGNFHDLLDQVMGLINKQWPARSWLSQLSATRWYFSYGGKVSELWTSLNIPRDVTAITFFN